MHIVGFLIFVTIIGFFIEMARKRGEFGTDISKSDQEKLNSRGLMLMIVLWVPTGLLMCLLASWAGNIKQKDELVIYGFTMISGAVPAGVFAALLNGVLENRLKYRIQKSAPRKR